MPLFEYMCIQCGKEFETFKSLHGTPQGEYVIDMPSCPDCNGDTKKIISVSNFHLKGGGWHKDLYGNKKE